MSLTTVLAIWGALLSTLVAVWNIVRDRLDRASVKVSVGATPVPDEAPDYLELQVELVNTGRRPVLIVACSLKIRVGGELAQFVPPPRVGQFPIKLNETERGWIRCAELTDTIRVGLEEVQVIDSTGRVWKAGKRRIRKELANVEEIRKFFEGEQLSS